MQTPPEISFALPAHNEAGNLPALVEQIEAAMAPLGRSYEIIVTDDRSTDDTWAVLTALAATHPRLRALRLERNGGQSAAMFTAIYAARGAIIVTMDTDLQNDPADLPKFLAALEGADCVCGTRQAKRQGGDSWGKAVTSTLANAIRSSVLGDTVSDAGCSYRAFRREAIVGIPFFKGVHRFLPILMGFRGARVVEIPINHRGRSYGQSHYGLGLLARKAAVLDMLGVRWLKSRMVRFRVSERAGKE
jgi:dolichol-phosphate mannosyltransferase